MTKTYPEGTRWALRLHSGEMALWFCHDEISRHERKARQTFATRAEAIRRLGCLNCAWTDAAVLVRIPPPRPKRSVEERIKTARADERADVVRWLRRPISASGHPCGISVREADCVEQGAHVTGAKNEGKGG